MRSGPQLLRFCFAQNENTTCAKTRRAAEP
jgi:hypothetical protein